MSDSETLRFLLRHIFMRQFRGGASTLHVDQIKYLRIQNRKLLIATPELSQLLWIAIQLAAKHHPDLFPLKYTDHFDFTDPLEKDLLGYNFTLNHGFEETIMSAMEAFFQSPGFPSHTDRSKIKTGINRTLADGGTRVTKQLLTSWIDSDIAPFHPTLAEWQNKGWIKVNEGLVEASAEEDVIEILEYIDEIPLGKIHTDECFLISHSRISTSLRYSSSKTLIKSDRLSLTGKNSKN